MKRSQHLVACVLLAGAASVSAQIKGAGSSFAANLYGSWTQSVTDVQLDYDTSGSSAGVKAAQERSVDFGASDRPLARSVLDQAGLIQFPTAIGGVVITVHLPGIASQKLRLSGEALAGLYGGTITRWNDPVLQALNPDLQLPAAPVVPVFRDEGSGTSFVLTHYLSKISPAFRSAVGPTSNFSVPKGKGGKTSKDVVQLVRGTPGAIGYLDYSYAMAQGIATVQMKNQWGSFVSADRNSLQMAMRAANWEKLQIDQDPTFEMDLTDAGCPGCWPIASLTYVLVPVRNANAKNSVRVLDFFEQALRQGDELADKKGYVPLPSRAKNAVSVAMRRWHGLLEKANAGKPQRPAKSDALPVASGSARVS